MVFLILNYARLKLNYIACDVVHKNYSSQVQIEYSLVVSSTDEWLLVNGVVARRCTY